MEKQQSITLRVVGYYDEVEQEWVAHALELDLVGTGSSKSEAEEQLKEAIIHQISFCKQEDINLFNPAPKRFFDIWNGAQSRIIRNSDKTSKWEAKSIPFNQRVDRDSTIQKQFSPV